MLIGTGYFEVQFHFKPRYMLEQHVCPPPIKAQLVLVWYVCVWSFIKLF